LKKLDYGNATLIRLRAEPSAALTTYFLAEQILCFGTEISYHAIGQNLDGLRNLGLPPHRLIAHHA